MKKSRLRALIMAVSTVTLAGCTATSSAGTETQETAEPSESAAAVGATAKAGTAEAESGDTEDTSAVQQEFPLLKVVRDRPLKAGYLHSNLEAEPYTRSHSQIRIEAPRRGWKLTEVYFSQQKPEEARTGTQTLITQDTDAVIIHNMKIVGIADLTLQVRQNGIGVYDVNSQPVLGVVVNSCQPDGVMAAGSTCYMDEKYLWNTSYAVITAPFLQVHIERTDPIKAIYDQYPGMKLLGEESLNPPGSESMGQQVYNCTKRLIEEYGTNLDILITGYDGVAATVDKTVAQVIGGTDVAIASTGDGSET